MQQEIINSETLIYQKSCIQDAYFQNYITETEIKPTPGETDKSDYHQESATPTI